MAKELIYTGRTLKGPEALACGLLNHLVPQNPENNAAYLSSLHIAKQIARNGNYIQHSSKDFHQYDSIRDTPDVSGSIPRAGLEKSFVVSFYGGPLSVVRFSVTLM